MYVECPLHCFSLISSIYEIIRIGLTKTMNNQDKKNPPKPSTSTTETDTKTCAEFSLGADRRPNKELPQFLSRPLFIKSCG